MFEYRIFVHVDYGAGQHQVLIGAWTDASYDSKDAQGVASAVMTVVNGETKRAGALVFALPPDPDGIRNSAYIPEHRIIVVACEVRDKALVEPKSKSDDAAGGDEDSLESDSQEVDSPWKAAVQLEPGKLLAFPPEADSGE